MITVRADSRKWGSRRLDVTHSERGLPASHLSADYGSASPCRSLGLDGATARARSATRTTSACSKGSGAQDNPAVQTGSKRARTDVVEDPNPRAYAPAPAAYEPQVENYAARQLL